MNRLAQLAVILTAAGALLTACKRPADLPDGNVSRTEVDFQAPVAGGNPGPETLYVSNSGRGTLEAPTVAISYQDGADWLTATVTSSGDQYAIAVQPVTTGLAAGTYRATLTLSWASGSAEPARVSVTLIVAARSPDAPRVSVSRSAVALQASGTSGDPQVEHVWIANDGGGTLATPEVSISYQDGAGWLAADVSATGAPYDVTLRAATAGLAPGAYRATVTLACAGASASPAQVGVTLTVPDPRFQLSVDVLAIDAPRGGGDPAPASFHVVNAGRGAIPVPSIDVAYAGTATGWLTTAVAAASNGYAVTAQARAAGIPSGVHHATLTVRAPGAAVPPLTLPVTLTVPPPEVSLSSREVAMRAPSGGLDVIASVTVANAGGGQLAKPVATVSYEAGSAASWDGLLDVAVSGSPTQYKLTFTAHQVRSTAAGSSKLPPGTYTAVVQVSAPGAAVSDTARVTLEVPAPAMQLSASAIAFAEYASCALPAPATVSVANVGAGELAAPVVTLEPGADAWLAASVARRGPDGDDVVVGLRAFPPVATGGTVETTMMISDPTGVASALPLRVRFDALVSDLSTATATPSPLQIWAQVGMGDPAPRKLSVRTPAGCFAPPSVSVAAADSTDPASWLSVGGVTSAPHRHDVAVLTSVAGLAAGEQRAATLRLDVSGKSFDVPVTLTAGALAAAGPAPLPGTTLASGRVVTPLADGRALTTGGGAGTALFDPATRTWTSLGWGAQDRSWHGAVELEDGRILVCGGYNSVDGRDLSSCEIGSWSSSSRPSMSWSSFGSLTKSRQLVTLIEMPRRRVLVVSYDSRGESPEILDLDTGRSTVVTGLSGSAAVKRPDGSILVAGGSGKSWLYRPELDSWAPAGDLIWDHAQPALMPLPDGRVMALGGGTWLSADINNVNVNYDERNTQLWNPQTNTWSRGPESPSYHTRITGITLLSSGKVLATNGRSVSSRPINELEVFDPVTGKWSVVGQWASSTALTSIVRLSTGMVLFADVRYFDARNTAISTAETYTW